MLLSVPNYVLQSTQQKWNNSFLFNHVKHIHIASAYLGIITAIISIAQCWKSVWKWNGLAHLHMHDFRRSWQCCKVIVVCECFPLMGQTEASVTTVQIQECLRQVRKAILIYTQVKEVSGSEFQSAITPTWCCCLFFAIYPAKRLRDLQTRKLILF